MARQTFSFRVYAGRTCIARFPIYSVGYKSTLSNPIKACENARAFVCSIAHSYGSLDIRFDGIIDRPNSLIPYVAIFRYKCGSGFSSGHYTLDDIISFFNSI